MVERFSDTSIEDIINKWLGSDEGTFYIDRIPFIFEGVTDGRLVMDIDEKKLFMNVDKDDGIPYEVECSSQNKKVIEFIERCNEKLVMKELRDLNVAMAFLLEQYSQIVKSKKIVFQSDVEMNEGDDNGDVWWGEDDNNNNGNQVYDSDMNNAEGAEDEEVADWGLEDNQVSEKDEYLQQILEDYQLENANKLKLGGALISSSLPSTVLNYKSVQMFEKTKLYKEALEALEYLAHNENIIQGWLNLVVIKEFLNIRMEIDLNYIDIDSSNVTIMGWDLEEPLIITLDISEPKMLNTDNNGLATLDFAEMRFRSMIQFQTINAGNTQSFGCNDFMRYVIQKFIEEELINKSTNDPQNQEEYKISQDKPKVVAPKEKKSLWQKLFSGSSKLQVNEIHLNKLLDMGYDFEMAKNSLIKAHNDLDKALEFIAEDVTGVFLDQKQQVPKTKNKIIKMMLFITELIESATSSCLLCHSPLVSDSIKLRTCGSDHCEFTFEENFGGTIFSEIKYNTEEAILDISLSAKALFSSRAGQVFEPFPTFFLKGTEMRGKRGNLDLIQQAQKLGQTVSNSKKVDEKNKDIQSMINILIKLPKVQTLIQKIENEQQLRAKLNEIYKSEKDGWKAYKILSYIFATNRTTIKKLEFENQIDFQKEIESNAKLDQYILISQDPHKERVFKSRKKEYGSVFCWHGSSQENWYSILRNGLRNLSNTQLMTAGAAYGNGIYASSNLSTSSGYTMRYSNGPKFWQNIGANLHQNYVIAICEIIKKSTYKKDENYNIVVVPDEDDIILRYLFIIKHDQYQELQSFNSLKINFEKHYYNQLKTINLIQLDKRKLRISKAFKKYQERKQVEQKELEKIKEDQSSKIEQAKDDEISEYFQKFASKISGKGSQVSLQRIQKEYAGLMKSNEFKDKISIDFHQNNIYVWRVSFDIMNYEISKDLQKDFQELQLRTQSKTQPKLQYEIFFSDTYPFEAPFIRVVFPRFQFRTGHVTIGGSICVQSLTPSGWSSARSLESYLVEIISLINHGDARLDLGNLYPYGLMEAKEAFNRVARDHGWLK
ncbi:uba ts-n domain containing protein [Stylonychia lemnae]|uniref:Uba ts-n domain containing protein n=1 Tax=Stylonychia lemnae TaxID=5949 RepID=A0A078AZG2_STYLE|nr:uba ts-n domain containing protein [Stylonychia lemnae]|eukprot:CDW86592.1 uba ts-n domain containing protein [Stylonychia lemnae]